MKKIYKLRRISTKKLGVKIRKLDAFNRPINERNKCGIQNI